METTLTSKGQITIPKHIRDSLGLGPGMKLTFDVNSQGELILRREVAEVSKPDGFDAVLGTADIKWDTDELMALMRGGE